MVKLFDDHETTEHKHTSGEENHELHRSPVEEASGATSQEHIDEIEQVYEPYEEDDHEKHGEAKQNRLELHRTTSRASRISAVSNRLDRTFTTRSLPEPGPPPDGGWRAWSQVACGWLVIFSSWGWVNSYGAWQTYYTLSLDAPPATIAWIGTVSNFGTFFCAFSGRLLDAGLFLPTVLVGATIQVLGIFLMSISTKFWQLMLTQGILTGLGSGILFTPCMGLMATYFSKHRAVALGVATTGNAVGGAIYPTIVAQLLPKIGFAWTARVLGFLNLGLLSVVIAFMRPRLPPRRSGPMLELSAFKEGPYAFFVLAMFFAFYSIYSVFYYVASFGLQKLGMSYEAATNMVVIVNAIGIPSRLIAPYFADKYGTLTTVGPSMMALTIVAYCWLAVHDIAGLYIFTIFYGITAAAFQCLFPSTVASLTPRLDMLGTRIGMAGSACSFAALTGPAIFGAIQTAMGGRYTGSMIFAATSTLLCVASIVASRWCKVGWHLHQKC
ncbi:hypothetical protein LTR78_006849 [Recurvomyces mirabilis]|uniref:Major facilitator superfamily (MFS) profile domain-containing protein n=1 Tax=Recurvomyces mirabilis TaxID=574656 RepID=A0AAE0WKB7_9PEZI|nr:hypothetical protein LTR78_006849 [Recurvomyces mirabilis]